ncbi:acyltransferase family protein [Phytoactinopolyspora mesophila]|uniref:Acyltransferase family protein n=1 Tax=Phytoactinopolyspora mesophila TaxID=2650750 RepID=A0A7K3M5I3_9ACTN|nr:acyltransferase [Phytoactinopolyspora mesophila]NDL58192.1 acyltransferase family protein [Phytoactinopolyspora mesophila]
MASRGRLGEAIARVDELAEATPAERNRAVDFLRVAAICVVVVWHWALSVNHRRDGTLVNPNPVEDVPGGWLLTWFLQVMPLFFIIGGYANLTGWDSVRRAGQGAVAFLQRRLSRLLLPALVFAVVWVAIDAVSRATIEGYEGALTVMPLLFTPLWFLGAYLWVTLLVPITATLHRRFGVLATVVLGLVVAGADLGRFAADQEWLGGLNTALVWVFAHQLGYLWRDGVLEPVWRRWAFAFGGLAVLAAATTLDVYPRSMVSIPGEDISHMLPTTAVIAALAVSQVGFVTLLAPALSRWMERKRPWRLVIALGSVLLTVFLWHMTAFLLVFLAVEGLGFTPGSEPTAEWWALRPFWIVAPALVLVVLVAIFAPVEQKVRRALALN